MSTNDSRSTSLPPDAIAALVEGNRIEAIKRTRAALSLDLKTAKDRVDAYVARDPILKQQFAERHAAEVRSFWRWVVVILLFIAFVTWFFKSPRPAGIVVFETSTTAFIPVSANAAADAPK